MPLPTFHSLSTAVAGFVIAAYWLVYVMVIAFDAANPATFVVAPAEAAQVCERATSHNEIARGVIGSCGSIERGEAAAEAETSGRKSL